MTNTIISVTDRTNTYMEVRTMEDNRMELNRAIFTIITSDKPMKEMKEEVKMVKNAGYQIIKCDVRKWSVENRKTNRHVRASVRWKEIRIGNSYRREYIINTDGCPSSAYFDRCKIDFVGILNTPINNEWIWVLDNRDIGTSWYRPTPTLSKYKRLQDAKHSVKWRSNEIVSIQKKIADLQKDLIYYAGEKVRAEVELNTLRKKLGLKTRR